MPAIDRFIDSLGSVGPRRVAFGLAVVSSSMLVLRDRRLLPVPLFIQYVLLSLLIAPQLYAPIAFVRLGLGLAVCLVLYVTAGHVQRDTPAQPSPRDPVPGTTARPAMVPNLRATGTVFRLLVLALGGVAAYGLWRTHPFPLMPSELSLAAYWLMSIGMLVALTSAEPLLTGFGLLTFMNGFEGMYLCLERSLLVVSLLNMVDLSIALGIVVCSEAWLESLRVEDTK